MTKLNMNELTNVTGGDSSDLFLLYAEYLDTLFEKYGIRGVKNIKKVCTPEEKASIKANTNITMEEMENLINDLRKCENPFNCPHGRPTTVYYSKDDLEKLFKRSGF